MNLAALTTEFIIAGVPSLAFQQLPNIPAYASTLKKFRRTAKTFVSYDRRNECGPNVCRRQLDDIHGAQPTDGTIYDII